jgi:hypothetical protein
VCRSESDVTVYLPIAGLSVDIFPLILVGGGIGFLSGLFGIGGGFLLTPLLIFLGIPSPVAVATGANQVMGSSLSGLIAHWRLRHVDVGMAVMLGLGGLAGATPGVWLFAHLRAIGEVDLLIIGTYVTILGTVGAIMLVESLKAWLASRNGTSPHKLHQHHWAWLPLKHRFSRSGLYISAILPVAIGALGGFLSAIMGVGGGFLLVPLMIYVLEMPAMVVVGTSLVQVIFVTANVTFMQAVSTRTVDILLTLILVVGGVVGAQFGARFDARLRPEMMRLLLSLLLLATCAGLLYQLVATPADLFSLA